MALENEHEVLTRLPEMPYTENCEDIFERLGAAAFVDSVRCPAQGPLSILETATLLGVKAKYMPIAGHGMYMRREEGREPEVIISTFTNEPELTFGHEIGHHFLEEVSPDPMPKELIEVFCEYFGRQMTLPEIGDEVGPDITGNRLAEVVETHNVRLATVLFALMEEGRLPSRVIVDSRIPELPTGYSQAVSRHIVCLACEYGNCAKEMLDNPEGELPLLDLTGYEYSWQLEGLHVPRLGLEDAAFKELQARYPLGPVIGRVSSL